MHQDAHVPLAFSWCGLCMLPNFLELRWAKIKISNYNNEDNNGSPFLINRKKKNRYLIWNDLSKIPASRFLACIALETWIPVSPTFNLFQCLQLWGRIDRNPHLRDFLFFFYLLYIIFKFTGEREGCEFIFRDFLFFVNIIMMNYYSVSSSIKKKGIRL